MGTTKAEAEQIWLDKAQSSIHEASELIANCYCADEDDFQLEKRRLEQGISALIAPSIYRGPDNSQGLVKADLAPAGELVSREAAAQIAERYELSVHNATWVTRRIAAAIRALPPVARVPVVARYDPIPDAPSYVVNCPSCGAKVELFPDCGSVTPTVEEKK
jgi:hypothetical protein